MRHIKFRTRLFIAFCTLIILAVALPGIYLYHTLRQEILRESTRNAISQLEIIDWMMNKEQPFENNEALDRWCKEAGEKLRCRITIIKTGGAVVADSSIVYNEIRFMENHADREELRAAAVNSPAISVRYSPTIKQRLIYAAKQIRFPGKPDKVFLRVAYPVSSVETRLSTYTGRLWAALALIIALTFVLSIYLARKFEAPIHGVMDRLKTIAGGDFSNKYILDSGEEFYQLSMTLNETAARIKEQMEVISEQNQEMEVIIENMREGVMLLDKNGRIKAINAAMAEIAQCRLSCIGKRPLEAFLSSEVQAACDKILQGKSAYTVSMSMADDVYYDMYAVKIAEGGALIVFYDVSSQRRLEKIRRDFVANVSHELKTPLTSIKGYVETLLTGNFSMGDQARAFLETIQKNAVQMANIVNDLLQLTRLEQKSPDMEIGSVDAVKSFEISWETCQPMAEKKQIQMDNRLKSPLFVLADEIVLNRIFQNLLDNAVRYSPENAVIKAFAETNGSEIIFGIQDQGPGILSKHQERIFERFYRVDKERSRASGGTGLGLSICRNAVSALNGRIWVQSPPEGVHKGSVFFFALPAAAGPDKNQEQ